MRDDFEVFVSYSIPMDLVARKEPKAGSKKIICGVIAAVPFYPKLDKVKVKLGVKLIWH